MIGKRGVVKDGEVLIEGYKIRIEKESEKQRMRINEIKRMEISFLFLLVREEDKY